MILTPNIGDEYTLVGKCGSLLKGSIVTVKEILPDGRVKLYAEWPAARWYKRTMVASDWAPYNRP